MALQRARKAQRATREATERAAMVSRWLSHAAGGGGVGVLGERGGVGCRVLGQVGWGTEWGVGAQGEAGWGGVERTLKRGVAISLAHRGP